MTTTCLGILGHYRALMIPTRVYVDLDFQSKLPDKKTAEGKKKKEKGKGNEYVGVLLPLPFFRSCGVHMDGRPDKGRGCRKAGILTKTG